MNTDALLASYRAAIDGLLAAEYGLAGELTSLPGEVDANLRLDSGARRYLVKIAAQERDLDECDLQIRVLEHLAVHAPELPLQRVVRTATGAAITHLATATGRRRVWVTTWLDGTLLAATRPIPSSLRRALGRQLGALTRALRTFEGARAQRPFKWDLLQAAWIGEHLEVIEVPELRAMVTTAHECFVHDLASRLARLRTAVIHGDANDLNVLVAHGDDGQPHIAGLLDFGDLCRSALVAEVAIAATYVAMAADEPLAAIDDVVAGYDAVETLTDDELEIIVPLIVTRLAVSITNAAVQARLRPDDPYVLVSQQGARALLHVLHDRCPQVAAQRLRLACGRAPSNPIAEVHAHLRSLAGVPLMLAAIDVKVAQVLDLSFDSLLAGDDPTVFSVAVASDRIAAALRDGNSKVGIGRYLEPRPIYTSPAFGADLPNARRRTVHLGIDVFAPAGTVVAAPLDSIVHHVEVCRDALDYGGLVVLRHELRSGTNFGTLYGHLDPDSVAALRPGQRLSAGQHFAVLGSPSNNGGWPPHLHLQVLAADPRLLPPVPPGVADPDDIAAHEIVYPDPCAVLGLGDERAVDRASKPQTLAERRNRHFSGNLRLSYTTPLELVRGWRHTLFDRQGRRHLDAYNNVPHVGHAHPRVVRAIAAQSALLATNTRYLHDGMSRYAERLATLLPPELSVFFFTPSGSEANELALRLVRAHTGAIDLCVMDHGYHGHTTGTMAISPYKFRQRNAPPKPDWVHVTVQPDVYRGRFSGPQAGQQYAAEVADTIADRRAEGRQLAGYLCECLPSVGGQLELPPGFLAAVYAAVRRAGGLCIADDVQTALWRTGAAFGFEYQGVVPDLLVLGKPLGNGFPLGAVVTTKAVAASFADGPEFFSTFGGSTVAMAAGLAVLDVLADENLATNATTTGEHLLQGLRALQLCHATIGDVRGRGLFLGVELVLDRGTKEPAKEIASYVKNRLRERRILIGTDGPFDNVLKIRPPMTFDRAAADLLLEELHRVLGEGGARVPQRVR